MEVTISSENTENRAKVFRFVLPESGSFGFYLRLAEAKFKNFSEVEQKTWWIYFGVVTLNLLISFQRFIEYSHRESLAFAISGIIACALNFAVLSKKVELRSSLCYLFAVFTTFVLSVSELNDHYHMPCTLLLLTQSPYFLKRFDFFMLSVSIFLAHQYYKSTSVSYIFYTLLIYIFLVLSIDKDFKKTSQSFNPQDLIKENIQFENDCGSPINNIMASLNYSLTNLKDFEEYPQISNSINSLLYAIKVLTKDQNLYSPSLKKITKNMNIEDKIFIEQNTYNITNFDISDLTPSKPIINDLVYGLSELSGILKQIGKDWNFNPFFVKDCTGGAVLFTCGEYIFQYYNFHHYLNIDMKCSVKFFKAVESKYLANPYHNSMHASDVMASFLYLCTPIFLSIPGVELFSCILACLGHDLAHPGTNNRFMVQTKHSLALQYNDNSVLENMHARDLFTIMLDENCNVMKNIGDYWVIRKIIIEMILATDMAKHFDIVSSNKCKHKNIVQRMETAGERVEIYKLFIKAADIAHTAKSLDLHERWCKLVLDEFFAQGDQEKKLGLPVSMYCDRNASDIPKSQSGFIKNISLPLFEEINRIVKWSNIEEICLGQLKKNFNFWNKKSAFARNSTCLISDIDSMRIDNRRLTLPKRRYL